MHLKDPKGKPVRPPKVPFWKDHFVFDGSIVLELPPGMYTFELECGPEYKWRDGYFQIEKDAKDSKTVEMNRFVEMKKEGWWSGDLHIHRLPAEIEPHLKAEDLHVGPVITWWNNRKTWQGEAPKEQPFVRCDTDRFYQLMGGEDEREGGALLY